MKRLPLSPDVLALNPGIGKSLAIADEKRDAKRERAPRADATERDGLSGLIERGWSTETSERGTLHRLREIWGARRETRWWGDLSLACAEAKEIEQCQATTTDVSTN